MNVLIRCLQARMPHYVLYHKSIYIPGSSIRPKRMPKHMRRNLHTFEASFSGQAPEILLNTNYEYWNKLKQDPKRYKAEKEQIADQVIALLEQRFPGVADQVEMRDVATPMTWERYTGNWQASHEGWLMTTKNLSMRLSKTLPGLKHFYMAGQWVEPGGSLPYVAVSGRNVTQIICKKDKKPFVTTTP